MCFLFGNYLYQILVKKEKGINGNAGEAVNCNNCEIYGRKLLHNVVNYR